MERHVTKKDIALSLDVSVSTVSRALINFPEVKEETKKQIFDLAKKWNYEPNVVAQNLWSKKTHILGVIVPEITTHFLLPTLVVSRIWQGERVIML